MRHHFVNLALALYLVALFGYAAWAEFGLLDGSERPGSPINRLDLALYALASLVLVVNVVRRPAPRAADNRWFVWLVCAISSLYFLAFEGSAHSLVVLLHVLGDAALIYLGRSFAILPAQHRVRTGFLYRLVRHPVYLTYMLTDLVLCASFPTEQNIAVALVGAITFDLRARLEEKLLSSDPAYSTYARRTRHRFVPGVY